MEGREREQGARRLDPLPAPHVTRTAPRRCGVRARHVVAAAARQGLPSATNTPGRPATQRTQNVVPRFCAEPRASHVEWMINAFITWRCVAVGQGRPARVARPVQSSRRACYRASGIEHQASTTTDVLFVQSSADLPMICAGSVVAVIDAWWPLIDGARRVTRDAWRVSRDAARQPRARAGGARTPQRSRHWPVSARSHDRRDR